MFRRERDAMLYFECNNKSILYNKTTNTFSIVTFFDTFFSHVVTVDFKMEASSTNKADHKIVKNDIFVLDVIKPVSYAFC